MDIVDEEPEFRPIFKKLSEEPKKPLTDKYYTPLDSIKKHPQISNPWNNPNLLSNKNFPSYFRPISTFFPISNSTAQSTHLPFGLVINPGLAADVPITDLSKSSIIRCPKCNAYLSPFSKISSDGKFWKCCICGMETMFINCTLSERKELTSPIIDIIAPNNYKTHENSGPSFLFILDISFQALISGFTQSAVASLLTSIEYLDDNTFVSIMTVNDKLTIYDVLKNNMTTYSELDLIKEEIYSHVCTIKDNKDKIISILKQIQKLSPENAPHGHCLGSAMEAAEIVLQNTGGVILAFVYNRTSIGPKSVSPRSKDDMVNEIALLKMSKTENSKFYANIGKSFTNNCICFHLFVATDGFADLAVMGVPCGLTAGKCHIYKNFDISTHSGDLHREIYRTITTKYLWDATMKLRISNGVYVRRIYSNCILVERDQLYLPAMSPEDSFTYEFEIQPHVTTQTVTFQFALAWNNDLKQRIIRVFTFSLPITEDPYQILQNVDEGALLTLLTKRTIPKILSEGAVAAARLFVHETKMLTTSSNFRSLPQFAYGILQSPYLSHNFPTGPDGRFSQIIQMRAAGIVDIMLFSYPRLLTIDNELITLSKNSIQDKTFLILHSVDFILIWGKEKSDLSTYIDEQLIDQNGIIDSSNIQNERIKCIIKECWEMSRRFLLLVGIYGEDKLNGFLIEDSISNNFVYSQWIQPFNPNLSK